MPAPITPRQVLPPTVGLLASVTPVPGSDLKWGGASGYSFQPLACDIGGTEDPCDVTALEVPDRPASIVENAFGIWSADRCTVGDYGGDWTEIDNRAVAQLEANQSKQIARELQNGTQIRASGWDNKYLTSLSSDVVTAAATTPLEALACLEQYLADCSSGVRGMIHASRQIATHWYGAGLLRREAGLTLTINDTIVVQDAGYDGSGPQVAEDGLPAAPSDGHVWAYATSLVEVRLGPIDVVHVVDRELNDHLAVARRLAAVTWDACCHGAAEMDLDLCQIGGPGS